jgi:hypothetical protein
MKKVIFTAILALSVLAGDYALAAGGGGAGSQTGDVSGKVYTPAYAACAGARVELAMASSGKISTTTDANGMYLIAGVPVGINYTVTATKTPYKPASKTLNVTAQNNTSASLVLKY